MHKKADVEMESQNRKLEKIREQLSKYEVIDVITAQRAEKLGIFKKVAGRPDVYQNSEVGHLWKISEDGTFLSRMFEEEDGLIKEANRKKLSNFDKISLTISKKYKLRPLEAAKVANLAFGSDEKEFNKAMKDKGIEYTKIASLISETFKK